MGAMSIMMMSSTSMTSTSGVTLMSALRDPFCPRSIAMACYLLRGLLDEVVDQLRRGVVHFDVEVLDAAGQVVVEPHRRDRDEQAERGFDERFGDTGRHRAEAARPGGRDALERRDDADDRAEQADERRGRADGRQ